MPELTPDHMLATTRAVRKRLDFDRPVPRELLLECLDLALQAPTGGNRQGWQFLFITDPAQKKVVADQYGISYDRYRQTKGPQYAEGDVRGQQQDKVISSSDYLRERMHEVPAMLIPMIEGRLPESPTVQMAAGLYGSILPAAWSFMLAARARGLGTTLTTLHLKYEKEVAEGLGIPYERFTQVALIPIGFYTGEDFKPSPKLPLESVMHWEKW